MVSFSLQVLLSKKSSLLCRLFGHTYESTFCILFSCMKKLTWIWLKAVFDCMSQKLTYLFFNQCLFGEFLYLCDGFDVHYFNLSFFGKFSSFFFNGE